MNLVLTPAEASAANALLAQLDAFIAQQPAARGYAHFRLEALFGLPAARPPYSSVAQMTSALPYGPFMSLDGFDPNAAGQAVLAEAAAAAINARYNLGIPVDVPSPARLAQSHSDPGWVGVRVTLTPSLTTVPWTRAPFAHPRERP